MVKYRMRPALIMIMAALLLGMLVYLNRTGSSGRKGARVDKQEAKMAESSVSREENLLPRGRQRANEEAVESLGARLARILEMESGAHRLTAEELSEYMMRNQRNAFSLVAAFEATLDPELLKEAALRFPNEPLVQAKVLMHNLLPEEREKWIEALKKSSPGNSLPHLLAAVDLMEKGDANAALNEVMGSVGKSFNDFSREGMIGLEEAYLSAGRPAEEALALSASELHLPALAPFKKMASQMADLAVEYSKGGDHESQRMLLEGVWQAGTQMRESGKNGPLLTDLVGLAMQNMALQRWPEGEPAHFLEEPVATRAAENQAWRKEVRATSGLFGQWLPHAPDDEVTMYYNRLRMLGELDAMKWLKTRHPELVEEMEFGRK